MYNQYNVFKNSHTLSKSTHALNIQIISCCFLFDILDKVTFRDEQGETSTRTQS